MKKMKRINKLLTKKKNGCGLQRFFFSKINILKKKASGDLKMAI